MGGLAQEDPQPAKCSWHATSPPADSSCPPLPPSLPQENPQFQPRLQEGISLGPFDAADEKWCKKAPWRCPAGSRPSRLQRLYADHSLVTRVVACLALPMPPSPYFPNTSCCHLHTGHVKRQHLHLVPFCSVPLNWPV